MKRPSRLAQKIGLGRAVCLGLLAALMLVRIWDPPQLAALRMRSFDFYQWLKPREVSKRPVVIVDIDEPSLGAYGQWPWPRTLLADLVSRLTRMGSVAVGFDIIFAEPDRMSPGVAAQSFRDLDDETRARLEKLPSNDEVLAAAMRQSRVVLGQSGSHLPVTQQDPPPPGAGFALMGPDPAPYLLSFPGIVRNIPVLEQAAAGRGFLTIRPEVDGIVRRVPVVMKADGRIGPALTLEMLRVATGAGAIRVKTDAAGIQNVAVPGLVLPTDRNGQLWIYFSPHDAGRYVSAKDVLEDRVPADRFRRHLVLVGTSAVGLRDIKATPIDPAMSGVEIHAQALENVLGQATLAYPGYAIGAELVITAIFGLAIIVLAPILGATTMLALGAGVAAVLMAGSWYFFARHHLLIDASSPLLITFLIYLALVFTNYFREQMQQRRIRLAFGQYLAAPLVEQLAHSHETLVLGGEERDMTIMFSDIRGFTTIAESYKHDPKGLTSLINHFLTPMTNAIIENRGTIDKYIGDAIMAFWNAPLRDESHDRNACAAALEMLRRVETLNQQRQREAQDAGHAFVPIKIGIGLNTGRCVVGNMGSDLRFNYSVLGDPVNLASRLEGQSKTYDVPIILGTRTALAAQETFAVLELDRITVKGKTEPETVYALLGGADLADSARFAELKRVFGEMLARYRGRDFAGATQALVRCREVGEGFGLRGLCGLYAARLAAFEKEPPPPGWDGVFALETK